MIQTPKPLQQFLTLSPETLIPHSQGMSLLDTILAVANKKISCQTGSHLLAVNPLKVNGQLSKCHLIEYAAQAIAVHGGLLNKAQGNNEPQAGHIAMVKSVTWGKFNPNTANLTIMATKIMADDVSKLYEYQVSDAEQQIVCSGKVLVVHPNP